MLLPSLTACLLLLSSGATALRHGEQDDGVVQAQWEAPHVVAAHHQRRDGFITSHGKRINRRTHAKLHGRQPPPPPPPGPPAPPPPGQAPAPGGSWKDKPNASGHVKVKVGELWRGETFRKPEDVRKAGGFESHAKRIFEGTHPGYPNGMTKEAFNQGSSVYHHSKKTCACSSYVSMSASKDEATNFASKQSAEKTYLYKIRPETSKVVDVAGSLGGDRHLTWSKEREIAGVYEVPWKQVIGWHEGTPTKAGGEGSKVIFSEFINKGDVYPDDPLPEEVALSGEFEIRPELAGFPEGHLGTKELPWKEFNDVPVGDWLNEYMLDRIFNNDKERFTEARSAAEWANLPCSNPKRKRAGAPAGCDSVKNQEIAKPGNVEDGDVEKPGNAEDDDVAKPGNKDDELGLGGEKPEPGSGSEPGELPEITEKWASSAEEISKREFTDLATSRGLAKVAKEKFSQTLTELRGKWLGYKALTKTSPKFKTIYGIAGKLAKPLNKIGAPLWVFGVIDAFARDASTLEKAAAITALIPFVGCTVDAVSKGSKGKISPLDTTLCLLADGLMFTPLWPAALVIQAVRAIINAFIPPDVPEPAKLHEKRDKEWANFLDNTIYTYIYSDEYASPEKTFREKMNSTFVAEAALVISDMADSIAVTNTTGQIAMEAEKDAGRKADILNGTEVAIAELRAGVDTEIRRRQRKAVLELPDKLTTSSGVSLKPLAKTFQDEYIANLQSPEFKKKYTDILKINAAEVEEKIKKAVAYIQPKAVALPTRFEVAYIIGQSKALEDIDPNALSAREFIMDNTKDLTEERANYFALHHTLQVAKLLRGSLGGGEEKLDTLWPTGDTAPTRPLQLLIAMRYGRVFEDTKMTWIRKNRKGVLGLFPDLNDPGEIHWASHPNIPPIKDPKANNEKLSYLGVVLGLSEEIIRNTPRGVQNFGFKDLLQNADTLLSLLKLDVHVTAKQTGADKTEDEKPKMIRL